MRAFITAVSLVAVLAAGAALAPGQSASSTRLGPLGIYQCSTHPEIQATWQARCPTCGTALQAVRVFDAAADTLPLADANYPDQRQSQFQNPPYGSQPYYPPPQATQYGTQSGYPPSGQYGTQSYPPSSQYGTQGYPPSGQTQGYPPSGQYGAQGYPPSQYGYPPSGQYSQGYPPSGQYSQGYPPPSGQYGSQGYPPSQYGYPPSGQYGQGYPPSGQYGQGYPPSGQYGQGYPPSTPYGYGQGGYTPPANPSPTEPNNPYGGLLNELNKLFNKHRQQGPPQP